MTLWRRASCVFRGVNLPPFLRGHRKVLAGRPVLLTSLIAAVAVVSFFTAVSRHGSATTSQLARPGGILSVVWVTRSRAPPLAAPPDGPPFSRSSGSRTRLPKWRRNPYLGGDLGRGSAVLRSQRRRRDPRRGAALKNLEEGRRAEGGSTITQQLARQSFLTRDKTYRRKLKEIILARYIENVFEERDPRDVSEQGVLRRRPLRRRSGGARLLRQERRDLDRGRGGAARRADPVAVELRADRQPGSRAGAPRRRAADDGDVGRDRRRRRRSGRAAPVEAVNDASRSTRLGPLFQGAGPPRAGRAVRLAARLRAACASTPRSTSTCSRRRGALVEKNLQDIERRAVSTHPPARQGGTASKEGESARLSAGGALVAIDPTTGYVRALVGGRDFNESRFNRAMQAKRQSGSAFKPFVYAGRARSRLHAGVADHRPQRSDPDAAGRVGARGRAQRRRRR